MAEIHVSFRMEKSSRILFFAMDTFMDNSTPNNPYQAPKATYAGIVGGVAPGEFILADRGIRLVAYIVESLILGVLVLLALLPFLLALLPFLVSTETEGIASKIFELFSYGVVDDKLFSTLLLLFLLFTIYTVVTFYLLYKNGQSIGKYLFSIKIVRTDGSRASLRRIIFLRYIPVTLFTLIPVVGDFIPFIDGAMIFRDSRKCLHDDIADTIVIKA